MISSIVKSAFLLTVSTTKKVTAIVAPITPVFVKKQVEKILVLGENLYEKPYETTKQVVPARLFNIGEKLWNNYGIAIASKSQSLVFSSKTWIDKRVAGVYSMISAVESFVKGKIQSTAALVSGTIKESHKYTVSTSQIAYNKAFSVVKSFSGKTA